MHSDEPEDFWYEIALLDGDHDMRPSIREMRWDERLWQAIKFRSVVLRGRWRALCNFCPQCNSDAPELYICPVCEYYNGPHPPHPIKQQYWWDRFTILQQKQLSQGADNG